MVGEPCVHWKINAWGKNKQNNKGDFVFKSNSTLRSVTTLDTSREVEGIQGAGSQIGFCGVVSPKSPELIN
jgi:hypothetical protein